MPLSDLAAALAAATGPSRDLDAEISTRLFGLTMWKPTNCGWFVSSRSHPLPCEPPRYTASLDAITGAIEARWPHCWWFAGNYNPDGDECDGPSARIIIGEGIECTMEAETPALALCLAAVRLAMAEEGR